MSESPPIDISVLLNVHSEGRLLQATVRNLRTAIERAIQDGFRAELIVVHDNADQPTRDYVAHRLKPLMGEIPVTTHATAYGDVGRARNDGARLARGEFIAFFAGDDLISDNFISDGLRFLQRHPRAMIHTEYIVSFGGHDEIWRPLDSRDPRFDPAAVVEYNPWHTGIVATKLARSVPFASSKAGNGFGPEDWHWDANSLAHQIEHYAVPGTSYFYRRKEDEQSLWAVHSRHHLLSPSALLRPAGLDSYLAKRKIYPVAAEAPPNIGQANRRSVREFAVRGLRLTARIAHRSSRVLLNRHQRLRDFDQQLSAAFKQLLRPRQRVTSPSELSPIATALPAWLLEQWRANYQYDPAIFPSQQRLRTLVAYEPRPTIYTTLYWQLARMLPDEPDYVFLVPWITRGGADLEIINLTKAILRDDPSAAIVVLATESGESLWRDRLPTTVHFIQLDQRVYELGQNQQSRLLGTLLVQIRPRNITLVNSPLGYRMIAEYAKALSQIAQLFVIAFCLDVLSDGQRVHYVLDYLPSSIEYLSKVLTDNQAVIDELTTWQGYDPEKFMAISQPSDDAICAPVRHSNAYNADKPCHVLWAGRLDWQKRPDRLVAIAALAQAQDLPVVFDVYGSVVLGSGDTELAAINAEINAAPNIRVHGAYTNGLATLGLDQFDIFLMTSEYEGLPNVLLEATAGGLPTIAPAVGGIPEFIAADKTGYLITEPDNAARYIQELARFLAKPDTGRAYAVAAQQRLRQEHTWEAFIRHLKRTSYFNQPTSEPYNKQRGA